MILKCAPSYSFLSQGVNSSIYECEIVKPLRLSYNGEGESDFHIIEAEKIELGELAKNGVF